jgi:hypothetical protein
MSLKVIGDKSWEWYKEHKRLAIFIALIIIVPMIIIAIPFCFFFTSPCESVGSPIGVEPQKLDVSLSPGKNFNKTISIKAYETGYVNLTRNAIKPMYDWVNFSNNGNVSVEADRTDYVNVEFKIPENATPGEYKGTIEITHNLFLFSWDDVRRDNNKGLRRSLKDVYKINWSENAKISKSDDNKTINITKLVPCFRYVAKITIDEKNEKATLKINDGNVYTLIIKKENGKQNIYRSVKEEIPMKEIPILLTIEPRETSPKNVSILLVP